MSLEDLIAAAPVTQNVPTHEMGGVEEAMRLAGVDVASVLTASRCKFGTANIEALVDDDTFAFVHTGGVLCTSGKRKMIGKAVKYNEIKFAMCRSFGPCEYTDERGLGKFGIEFAGPGNVLLGRLHWSWRAKRFRDSSAAIMAVAEERDRVLSIVTTLLA